MSNLSVSGWCWFYCAIFFPVVVVAQQHVVGDVEILPAQSTPRMETLDYELNYLSRLWTGEYDNREQLQFDVEAGRRDSASGLHRRWHHSAKAAEIAAWGNAAALLVTEYPDNDPKLATRRVYALSVDRSARRINASAYGVNGNSATLSADDLRRESGCDLALGREADTFVARPASSAICAGRSPDYALRIDDRALRVTAANKTYVLERARRFVCMVDFPKVAGKPAMYTDRYIVLHDQGGTYPFRHPDGREMVLTLRNNWSYGMYRETLVVVIQEGDEAGPTLTYGWTEPGADRIGVNPGWMRVQCDLDTPANRQAQQQLRADS
jgi:hypothetical protein